MLLLDNVTAKVYRSITVNYVANYKQLQSWTHVDPTQLKKYNFFPDTNKDKWVHLKLIKPN